MAAGTGADEQARRLEQVVVRERAALAEQERRTAAVEAQVRNWRVGAEGERLVAHELDALHDRGWRVLHDVHWPGRPKANLDHVAIGPGGVVVIDTKNWSGSVSTSGGVLRCSGYRKTKESEAAAQMAAAVAALLEPQHRALVRGAVALVQQEQAPTAVEAGTVVVGRSDLAEWLASSPPVLSAGDVDRITGYLAPALAAATTSAQLTTASLSTPSSASSSRRPPQVARTTRVTSGRRRPRPRSSPRSRAGGGVFASLVKLAVIVVALLTMESWLGPVSGFVSGFVVDAIEQPAADLQTVPQPTVTPLP